MKNLFLSILTIAVAMILSGCSDSESPYADYGWCSLSGTVSDADGQPVSLAKVRVMPTGEGVMPFETDAQGRYAFYLTNAKPEMLLEVIATGYETNYTPFSLEFKNPIPGETLGKAPDMILDVTLHTEQ